MSDTVREFVPCTWILKIDSSLINNYEINQ